MSKRKSFLLRLQPAVFEALQKWADDEFRSINGHLEYLLSDQLKKASRFPKPHTKKDESAP